MEPSYNQFLTSKVTIVQIFQHFLGIALHKIQIFGKTNVFRIPHFIMEKFGKIKSGSLDLYGIRCRSENGSHELHSAVATFRCRNQLWQRITKENTKNTTTNTMNHSLRLFAFCNFFMARYCLLFKV